MNFITASTSERFMDRELLKLSSSAHVLSGLLLKDLSFTAFMRSQVRSNKTFASSYNVSFQKACVTDMAKDLVLRGVVQNAV